MNNPVEEAIGGYIASENDIAANSRLRRDDVGELCGRHINQPSNDDGLKPHSPTDQALIEGLAGVLCEERNHPDWPCVRRHTQGDFDEAMAKAALTYMQQHVRPLVVALEVSNQALSMLGSEIPKLKADTGKDPRLVTPANYAAELSGMATKRINQALSSLPPVLRGGE